MVVVTVRIPLTRGMFALVDDDDAALVANRSWYVSSHGYAARGKKTVYMHRLIMGPGPGELVDHINGDTLDNRRCNLR